MRRSEPSAGRDTDRNELIQLSGELLGPFPWVAPTPLPEYIMQSRPFLKVSGHASESDVRTLLQKIVEEYTKRIRTDDSADRSKTFLGKLESIEKGASRLAAELKSLNNDERLLLLGTFAESFERLEGAREGKIPAAVEFRTLSIKANPFLPRAARDADAGQADDGRLVDDLRTLAAHVEARRLGLIASALELRDRGGRTNMARKLRGTPKWFLVSAAWLLVVRSPEAKPSGSSDGLVMRMAQYLHEAATGERQDHAAFQELVKQMAKLWREFCEVDGRIAAIRGQPRMPFHPLSSKVDLPTDRTSANAELTAMADRFKEFQRRLIRGPRSGSRRSSGT